MLSCIDGQYLDAAPNSNSSERTGGFILGDNPLVYIAVMLIWAPLIPVAVGSPRDLMLGDYAL